MQTWQSYEQVARFLLEQFAAQFGLSTVQGKQLVRGASGTDWEIDAKAVKADGGGFLVVECRRYLNDRLSQEDVGALCYRIQDTGASGGITVSPLPLQKGAHLSSTCWHSACPATRRSHKRKLRAPLPQQRLCRRN